jgi:L-Ala-D/L-Glu epimerase
MIADEVVPAKMSLETKSLELKSPFAIFGHVFTSVSVLRVRLEYESFRGFGEAAGVYYRQDVPEKMLAQLKDVREKVERGVNRDSLLRLLAPGGARNAVDCALWDLQAKLAATPVWKMAGLEPPRPIVTTFTCSADSPLVMARAALGYADARAIKLKLTGDDVDAERIAAVREARADVWLGIDANQGFSRKKLEELMPTLIAARVQLIEQPLPIGQEARLEGFKSPIPIAADESIQSLTDLPDMVGRFSVINIKLDKCGGLTEALEMARRAYGMGLGVMVGNMIGTSLAMAPAYLVGQMSTIVDLDGPIYIKQDTEHAVDYSGGQISCSLDVWGGPN